MGYYINRSNKPTMNNQFVYLVQGHADYEGALQSVTRIFATYEAAYDYGQTLEGDLGIDFVTVDEMTVR